MSGREAKVYAQPLVDLPGLPPPPTKGYWMAPTQRHVTSKGSGKEGRCELLCEKRTVGATTTKKNIYGKKLPPHTLEVRGGGVRGGTGGGTGGGVRGGDFLPTIKKKTFTQVLKDGKEVAYGGASLVWSCLV